MNEAAQTAELGVADILRIMRMIPHRYPMLMVDRVTKIVPGESAVGIKNVTINEPHFQGHFPTRPVMPGVLIVESMAQTAGVLVVHTLGPSAEGKLVYFMSIEQAKFRRPVVPGDTMYVHVSKEQARRSVWRFAAKVMVEEQLAAEAGITAMIIDE
jgi:3-hydroxyacyl-[acyl-carrier-protein] dehydratase